MPRKAAEPLRAVGDAIERCRACPRLVAHCAAVARARRAAFADEVYWGRPVRGFGDPAASLVVLGLAPAAHGANRTGRVFTGDESGRWLYRALHRAGLASDPASVSRDDGLVLRDVYVSVVVRCAPPGNAPTPVERDRCLPFLVDELAALPRCRAILALGAFAWDGALRALAARHGARPRPRPRFAHGAELQLGGLTLVGSYHVSQQNTFTGRLTEPMLDEVLARARAATRT